MTQPTHYPQPIPWHKVQRVMETRSEDEANALLSRGWTLLGIFTSAQTQPLRRVEPVHHKKTHTVEQVIIEGEYVQRGPLYVLGWIDPRERPVAQPAPAEGG